MMKERTELTTLALSGLLDFWLGKCSNGTPPVSSTIAPADLRPWKDNIVVFEVIGDDDFVYSYYGKSLAEAWGHSRLGHTLDSLPDEQRAVLAAEYAAVLRERLPVTRVYTGDFAGTRRTFERLVLPLSSDGATVDKLLVAAYELTGPRTGEPASTEPRAVEAVAPDAANAAPGAAPGATKDAAKAPAATQTSGATA